MTPLLGRQALPARPQLTIQPRNFAADDPGGWDRLVDTAVAADAAGIDRIILSDHVVFGENPEAYADPTRGGTKGGRQPTGPDGHWLEPLTTLAFLAGQTTRVRLGTSILLAALRRPVVLAKTAATLDVLSGGRFYLGVGVGWQEEEYTAAGLEFAARGRQLDHTLEVCQTLWGQSRASFESPELSFDGIHAMPKPLQAGGVPIWIGGTVQRRSMERLARFGSGWIPWGPAVADLKGGVRAMRGARATRTRPGDRTGDQLPPGHHGQRRRPRPGGHGDGGTNLGRAGHHRLQGTHGGARRARARHRGADGARRGISCRGGVAAKPSIGQNIHQ